MMTFNILVTQHTPGNELAQNICDSLGIQMITLEKGSDQSVSLKNRCMFDEALWN